MIDEEKLKEYIKRKCYELTNLKWQYEHKRDDFFKSVDSIKGGSGFWLDQIDQLSSDFKNTNANYETKRFDLHQLCWVLGDEYKQIYKDILKEE